jgi:hypothetical protein
LATDRFNPHEQALVIAEQPQCKVLEDFAAGGFKGEGLMASIIALINDTRESLAGMATAGNGAKQSPVDEKVKHT